MSMIEKKWSVIASDLNWVEGESLRQLEQVSNRPGVRKACGLPDIHPGKGSPIGASFLCDIVYPDIVGSDIGCGMGLWMLDHHIATNKKEKMVAEIAMKLNGLDAPWEGDTVQWLSDRNIERTPFDSSLGTPGFGNHFIEILQLDTVVNESLFDSSHLTEHFSYLMVHSGSRSLGESVLREYTSKYGSAGVVDDSPEGKDYLRKHDHAVRWAEANRDLCAQRVLDALDVGGTKILDITHNSVTESVQDGCKCFLHRKGAAPTDKGLVVIPGSRGDLSYLVQPTGLDTSLNSLAHGAGRKLSRSEAQGKLEYAYKKRDIKKNKWGGQVVCGEKNLLWEEAPECYKNIAVVIQDLIDAGLINVIATLRPVVTFKTSEGVEEELERGRKNWQRDRKAQRDLKQRMR